MTSIGNITTAGNGAFGIEAVNAGAGAVTVTSTGNITTAGNNAYGIYAQSTGGGAVTVTSTGNITTGNAFGILARQHGWRCDGDLDRQHHHVGQPRGRDSGQ